MFPYEEENYTVWFYTRCSRSYPWHRGLEGSVLFTLQGGMGMYIDGDIISMHIFDKVIKSDIGVFKIQKTPYFDLIDTKTILISLFKILSLTLLFIPSLANLKYL